MASKKHGLKKLSASILGLIASQAVFAGDMGPVAPAPAYSFITSISIGPAWEDEHRSQTLALTPEIVKTYHASSSSNTLVNGELFFGIGRPVYGNFTGVIGVALAASSAAKLNGVIWDDADPIFNNYLYRYRVDHAHVAVEGRILGTNPNFYVTPWIGASVGVAANRARDFDNTPVIFEAVKNPNFRDRTTSAFTYTLAAGIQKNVSELCQVGVSYQFADWGKSQLGPAPGQVFGKGLKLNHLYTNGVMFNITFMS